MRRPRLWLSAAPLLTTAFAVGPNFTPPAAPSVISYVNELRLAGTPLDVAIREGAILRLRPIR